MTKEIEIVKRLATALKQAELLQLKHHKNTEVENVRRTLSDVMRYSMSVMVCREFRREKPYFINPFLNENLCPTDDRIATSVVSIIRYGEKRKTSRYYPGPSAKELLQEEKKL